VNKGKIHSTGPDSKAHTATKRSKFSMQTTSVLTEISVFKDSQILGNVRLNEHNYTYIKLKLAELFCDLTADFSFKKDVLTVSNYIDEFLTSFIPGIPEQLIKPGAGSTGILGLFPLYLAARCIQPSLIIESGVFVGASLNVFDSVFSKTTIHAFDIDLSRIKFQPRHSYLHEMDWIEYDNLPRKENSLVFFDDHINCALRIRQCIEKGIQYAIFDDSPPIGKLVKYRYPALPSIPVIMDTEIPDGCIFEWHHTGTEKKLRYKHDAALCASVRSNIKSCTPLDRFEDILGLGCGDKWFIELNPQANSQEQSS